MSIRAKLFFAFGVLAVGAFGLSALATNFALRRAASGELQGDVQHALDALAREVTEVERLDAAKIDSKLDQHVYLAELDRVDPQESLGFAPDPEQEARDLAHAQSVFASAEFKGFEASDVFLILDRKGRIIFNRGQPASLGDTVMRSADTTFDALRVIREALSGKPSVDLWPGTQVASLRPQVTSASLAGEMLLVTALPLIRGNLKGVVVTSRRVSRDLLPQLDTLTDARVALRSVSGEISAARPDEAAAAQDVATNSETKFPTVGLEQFIAVARPLTLEGSRLGDAIVMRPYGQRIRDVTSQYWSYLRLSAALIAVLALGITQWLTRLFARPLIELEAAAREVSGGNLAVRVQSRSSDEIGRLARAFNAMVDGLKQRDQIKGLFKRYLNPQVVEELIRHPERTSTGSERRVMTVMFADLVGFTTFSEKLSPEELLEQLNRYFEAATKALAGRGATFDKFIGDAIMCFWNAPMEQRDHAVRACLAALDLLDVVGKLAVEFERLGLGRFTCRIGVNTGPCVVGFIRTTDVESYTVFGDTVNAASRLEGAAKIYGVRVLVSEETLAGARGEVLSRELDIIRVKGRSAPIRVHELIGRAEGSRPAWMDSYAAGLSLYRERKFEQARMNFAEHLEDPASAAMAARCAEWVASPPPPDWDGVFTLDSK